MAGISRKGITRVERVYNLLKDGRIYRASTLNKVAGWRFGAAIFKLREMGCDIVSLCGADGEWRYRLEDDYFADLTFKAAA